MLAIRFSEPPFSRIHAVDPNKPVFLHAGSDSFADIGTPPAGLEAVQVQIDSPLELWKTAYMSVFPQQEAEKARDPEDPCADSQFKEDKVDAARQQRDQALHQYIEDQKRRHRIEGAAEVEHGQQ